MKYSKCRCIKAVCTPQPDEMCVTNVLGRRLMRWYALRDTAGRTERLYRSSCTLLLTHLRVAKSLDTWKVVRIETPQRKRGGESLVSSSRGESRTFTFTCRITKIGNYFVSVREQLENCWEEEFVSHRSVRG